LERLTLKMTATRSFETSANSLTHPSKQRHIPEDLNPPVQTHHDTVSSPVASKAHPVDAAVPPSTNVQNCEFCSKWRPSGSANKQVANL
jgi:hypothetical protein